jgi:predicted membrane GTPase involved in stress response
VQAQRSCRKLLHILAQSGALFASALYSATAAASTTIGTMYSCVTHYYTAQRRYLTTTDTHAITSLLLTSHHYSHMEEHCGQIGGLSPGKLVSMERGKATSYALFAIQERGKLFVENGQEIYSGMVVGENSRAGDMEVNPCKAKKVTNVRSVSADEKLVVAPAQRMSVEEMIAYMGEDEMIEVTPRSVRLRKAALDPNTRARLAKAKRPQKQ